MLSLTNLVSILPALVAPILIGRMRSQSLFAFELTALYAIATVGLIVAMDAAVLWVVILGVAQGATLGLALTLIVLRSPDAQVATRLSGMSQSWGYGLAAAGPLLLGSIYDLSLTWTVPLLLLLALLLPQAVTGYLAGRPRLIGAGRANAVAGGLD
jgi:CP family cyanate transporter-like MFS transporter